MVARHRRKARDHRLRARRIRSRPCETKSQRRVPRRGLYSTPNTRLHSEAAVRSGMRAATANHGEQLMEYRQLGGSGFKVPALSLGTGTFGGGNEFFKAWGASDVAEATRLVDICLEAGAHHVRLGRRLLERPGRGDPRPGDQGPARPGASSPPRARFRAAPGPNDVGSSRHHLMQRGRGEPAAARHRLHRPLPAARLRRADAGRGGARHARRPRARRARSATSAARTSPAGT